jgi:hypothetical protein
MLTTVERITASVITTTIRAVEGAYARKLSRRPEAAGRWERTM